MKQQTFTAPAGKITNVSIKDNKVVVEYEPEFEPKDGDFVKLIGKYSFCIGIYKKGIETYCSITQREGFPRYGYSFYFYEIEMPTECERQILLDALKKDGRRWNAEKKCIEEIRWMAEKGERYYTIVFDDSGVLEPYQYTDGYSQVDNRRYNLGRYLQHESDAQRLCDLLNETVKNFK